MQIIGKLTVTPLESIGPAEKVTNMKAANTKEHTDEFSFLFINIPSNLGHIFHITI